MHNFLQNIFDKLTTDFLAKTNVAEWFNLQLKTHLSKNITLEDWNTLQVYIKNNVSDIQSLRDCFDELVHILDDIYISKNGGTMTGDLEIQNSDNYNARYHASGFKVGNNIVEANLNVEENKFEFSLNDEQVTLTPSGFSSRKGNKRIYYKSDEISRYNDDGEHYTYKYPNKSGTFETKENVTKLLNEQLTKENLGIVIGNATQSLAGLMSGTDKKHLDTLVALLEEDDDNVVNTINEILAIFNQYPEGAEILSVLSEKLNKNDLIPTIEANAEKTSTLDIGTSATFDATNDKQIPTSKAVAGLMASAGGGSTTPQIMITNPTQSYENVDYNKYYVFEEITHSQFTLSIGTQKEGVVNELMGEIRLDENPLEVQFTQPIRWNENDKVEKNGNYLKLSEKHIHIYSVINGLGLITSFENPALATPINLVLNDDQLSWDPVENVDYYKVMYNLNNPTMTITPTNVLVETESTSIDLTLYDILKSVNHFSFYIKACSNKYTDTLSDKIGYKGTGTLDTPTNLILSDTNQLSWDSVNFENTSTMTYKYIVTLVETGTTVSVTTNLCDLSTSFTELATPGTYTFNVKSYTATILDASIYWESTPSESVTVTIQ